MFEYVSEAPYSSFIEFLNGSIHVAEQKQTIDNLKWVASEQPNFSQNNKAEGTNVIVPLISWIIIKFTQYIHLP